MSPCRQTAVLHALTDKSLGGAGVWLSTILRESSHKTVRYGVILPKGSAVLARLPKARVSLYELPISEASFSPADLLLYRRAIADFSPDVLVTHGALTARIAALTLADPPFSILTKHCVFESARARHPLLAALSAPLIASSAHLAVATADCAARMLVREGFPPSRILTVPNGTIPCRTPSEAERLRLRHSLGCHFPFTVGFCARIEPEKNPFFILRLANEVRNDPRFGFLVVGDGSCLKALRRAVCRLGLADRFCFTGFSSDVSLPMSLFDLQLNASILSETTCLSLLEGFSLGIPALVSDCGGNKETVRNGINGFRYPKNNVSRAAALLCRMADDAPLLAKMGGAARAIYEKEYRASLTVGRCERLYRTLRRFKD